MDRVTVDDLRRPFIVGVVAVLALFAAVGIAIKVLESGHHRPEGTAERWLDAVSDTTRNGVKTDGRARAERLGPGVSYAALLPANAKGKHGFKDLQVGKAKLTGRDARVPFETHRADDTLVRQTIVLHHQLSGTWLVTGVSARRPGEAVPSEGGSVPSKVAPSAWFLWLGLALVLTVACSALVRWSGRPAAATSS